MSRILVFRGLAFLRSSNTVSRNLFNNTQKNKVIEQQIRNSGNIYLYRDFPLPNKERVRKGTILSAITWWWILWHFFTEYEELIGPSFPHPSEFTDEELGIPPA